MKRILLVLVAGSLVLAPPAFAKGPYAVLWSDEEPIEPGQPWVTVAELNELDVGAAPKLVAVKGDRRVPAQMRRLPDDTFKTTLVFPAAGRWRLLLNAGGRSLWFKGIRVGTGLPPKDYLAFPAGTDAAKHGATFIHMDHGGVGGGVGGGGDDDDDGGDGGRGGVPWILPLAGLVLAGAGVAIRLRPRGRRRGSGAPQPPNRG
ncbi:MAG: hypothetical protein QOE69_2551 [Thermoleophilaceae bacterium]|nr:hypothetical protein [Thermoleophilaceae bacterium]